MILITNYLVFQLGLLIVYTRKSKPVNIEVTYIHVIYLSYLLQEGRYLQKIRFSYCIIYVGLGEI